MDNGQYVGYMDSPLGRIRIGATENGVWEVSFDVEESEQNERLNPHVVQCREELNEYFDGKRKSFEVSLDPSGTTFQENVWNELLKIPFGETISYHELSVRIGNTKAIRAVGAANGKNKIALIIPCHRVIGKDGSFVGYAAGIHRKKWLFEHETGKKVQEQLTLF